MTMIHAGFNLISSIVPLVKTFETRKITDKKENIYKERTLPLIAMQNVVSWWSEDFCPGLSGEVGGDGGTVGQVWLREVRGGKTTNKRSPVGPIGLRARGPGLCSFPTRPWPYFASFSWLISLPSWAVPPSVSFFFFFFASRFLPARMFRCF